MVPPSCSDFMFQAVRLSKLDHRHAAGSMNGLHQHPKRVLRLGENAASQKQFLHKDAWKRCVPRDDTVFPLFWSKVAA